MTLVLRAGMHELPDAFANHGALKVFAMPTADVGSMGPVKRMTVPQDHRMEW